MRTKEVRKRVLTWFLLVVMSISMLAGCGKNNDSEKKESVRRERKDSVTISPTAEPTAEPTAIPTVEPTATPIAEPTPKIKNTDYTEPGCEIAFAERELYHYDMDLKLNEEDNTIGGHVKFECYNDSEDTWNELCLRDYPSLFTINEAVGVDEEGDLDAALTEINNITDGRDNSKLTYERDEDISVVWLKLANPLATGEKMTLEYDFKATIPAIADRFGAGGRVFNVTNFYPILAEYVDGEWSHEAYFSTGECFYSEVSNYDVRLTVPYNFKVATTGTQTGFKEEGDTVTYTYKAPCVRDFVFSASSIFKSESKVCGDVTVNVFCNLPVYLEEEYETATRVAFEAAEDSLAAFGNAFGQYPYPELDIVITPISAGGMEYPNLVIIGVDYLTEVTMFDENGNLVSEALIDDFKVCVAHEIGHQWFMGIVGSNSGMNPWLDESFASYSELVYADYLSDVKNQKLNSMGINSKPVGDFSDPSITSKLVEEGSLPIDLSYYDYKNDTAYVIAVYYNGTRVLRQMEEILGHDEFQSIIREYVALHAFTNVKPYDFFEVLYRHAGNDNEELNALIENVFEDAATK